MTPSSPSFPTPASSIVVRLQVAPQRSFQQIVMEMAQLDVRETQGALQMGDLFCQIQDRWGTPYVKKAARLAGVSLRTALERCQVARQIPPDSPLRRLRALRYTHLRTIAGTENPEYWAQRVIEEQLTTRQLIAEIEWRGDQQARRMGEPCGACGEPLPPRGNIVGIAVGQETRVRCCGPTCAIGFLTRRLESAGAAHPPTGDPFAG